MRSMTKIFFPLAVVVGSASVALAGPKDAFWPKDTTQGTSVHHQAPARTSGRHTSWSAYAYAFEPAARGTSRVGRSPETYIEIQSRGIREWI